MLLNWTFVFVFVIHSLCELTHFQFHLPSQLRTLTHTHSHRTKGWNLSWIGFVDVVVVGGEIDIVSFLPVILPVVTRDTDAQFLLTYFSFSVSRQVAQGDPCGLLLSFPLSTLMSIWGDSSLKQVFANRCLLLFLFSSLPLRKTTKLKKKLIE